MALLRRIHGARKVYRRIRNRWKPPQLTHISCNHVSPGITSPPHEWQWSDGTSQAINASPIWPRLWCNSLRLQRSNAPSVAPSIYIPIALSFFLSTYLNSYPYPVYYSMWSYLSHLSHVSQPVHLSIYLSIYLSILSTLSILSIHLCFYSISILLYISPSK